MNKMFNIISIGEIVYDIYEHNNKKQLGGAPFNYCYHLNKFGNNTIFISKIGDDTNGKNIIYKLDNLQFPTDYIQKTDIYPTGKVLIKLNNYKVPEYNIVENTAYDFIKYNKKVDNILIDDNSEIDLIYFGTLCQRNKVSRDTINRIITSKKGLKFYDINLRQNYFSKDIIENSLNYCDILKLNINELLNLQKMFELNDDIENSIKQLYKEYNISYICTTFGEKGSLLYHNDNFTYKKLNKDKVVDTVGAGDAFSALLTIGILNKWADKEILDSASSFADDICKIQGAIPYDMDIYSTWSHSCEGRNP